LPSRRASSRKHRPISSDAKEFTPAEWKVVVRPNVDTLYSPATLDLEPEPIVFAIPATDRYFVMPMMSLWTDVFAAPGTRPTGRNAARNFLLVGPKWQGAAPSGMAVIRSPTRIMNIGGRTQTNGVADYKSVHKIQAGYKLTPLSAFIAGGLNVFRLETRRERLHSSRVRQRKLKGQEGREKEAKHHRSPTGLF
jgi:hypothetical protein